MDVTLKGAITDTDGSIKSLSIDWGDNDLNNFTTLDYAKIAQTHTYKTPGNYVISLTATDNLDEISTAKYVIKVDYKETSLMNIKQSMFKTSPGEYLILTINLHTYQELRQNEKFVIITDLIGKMDIDFVAIQECAQNKASVITTGIIRTDNMALIIANQLKQKYNADYNFVWNWAHYGWDVWEEGIAVLSKHTVQSTDQRYISSNLSNTNIASRKAIYASYSVNGEVFNIFSAHTHWRTSETDQEQNRQINSIKQMVTEKQLNNAASLSIVCGDFNGNPTDYTPWNEGYNTMTQSGEYIDTFLAANPDANTRPALSKYFTVSGSFPGRIDYIFMKSNSKFKVINSQIVLSPEIAGIVSDHYGVLTKIQLIPPTRNVLHSR
ncbi:MAG TPA: hypothetical protein DCQ31_07430 [Bacteroidales bacterium]|nr:hypothetical protein [Bacteroidales bacterium]